MKDLRSNGVSLWLVFLALGLVAVVLAIPAVFVSYRHAPSRQPSPTLVTTIDQPISKNEIGRLVEETLRNAVYLEITAKIHNELIGEGSNEISGGLKPIVVEAKMARDLLKSLVFDASDTHEEKDLLPAFSLLSGRIQEYRPSDHRVPLREYESPYENGTDEPVGYSDVDCLFGNFTFSWIVPEENDLPWYLDPAVFMRAMIDSGEQEPDAIEGGRLCFVFRQKLILGGDTIYNVLCIVKETKLPARWDTIQQNAKRVREFNIRIGTEVPSGTEWGIEVPAGIVAVKVELPNEEFIEVGPTETGSPIGSPVEDEPEVSPPK